MSRWQPEGRRRLQEAALALFAERGFAQTTAAAIAERAGLTEQTFFRYFPDKREVLFDGGALMQEVLIAAVAGAPAGAATLDVILAGLTAVGSAMQPNRPFALRRAKIIADHPELQERELAKLEGWAAALTVAFTERGQADAAAQLAAGLAITLFRNAFQRWITDPGDPDLADTVRSVVRDLDALVS